MSSGGELKTPAEQILDAALYALELWEMNGISVDDYLEYHLPCLEYRRSVADLLFTYFRRKKFIDRILNAQMSRQPAPEILDLLKIASTQVIFQTGVPQPVAVSVAVDNARERFDQQVSGFVNAVLRKICDKKPPFKDTAKTIFPAELYRRWKAQMPKKVEVLASVFLSPADFTCRDIGDNHLDMELFKAEPIKLDFETDFRFYKVGSPAKMLSSKALNSGEIYVQDPATALSVSLVEFKGDESVLDICSAPGGKSLMMIEQLNENGSLVASDRSERRQKLTKVNLSKGNFAAKYSVQVGDAEEVTGEYDVVFCDVPCSNTGVFRRRPDALWRFSEKRLEELLELQCRILMHAATLVKAGGKLVYSTCSIETVENGEMVAHFLEQRPQFKLIKQRQCFPDSEHDGAYAAVLQLEV